jgi:hypothetical protein
MEICHLTLTAARESRLPLFPDEATYLRGLHRLGAVAGGCLALFALIAEHVHLVALLSRLAAGRLAQRVSLALRPIVATALAPSYIKVVDSRSYLRWLVRYILEQPRQHGMPGPEALWVGSCLPDLVGARIIPGLTLALTRALPEVGEAMLLRLVGLSGGVVPAGAETLRAIGAAGLRRAVAATLGASDALTGNHPVAVLGRRALASIAREIELPLGVVARSLGRSPRTAWRLCRDPLDAGIVLAVKRRVSLERLALAPATESRR